MPQPLKKLAIVVNDGKSGARAYAGQLLKSIQSHLDAAELFDGSSLSHHDLDDVDACCVIGGDGTILGVVKSAVRHEIPVIGINYGKLGFLTTYTQEEAERCLPALIGGDYLTTERTLLAVKSAHGREAIALNDVVVKGAQNTGLAHLQVWQNGKSVNNFSCDGLIIATPTGSTAYNLAAGGPIMHPAAEAIAMTPISPHTLSNRSVVFSSRVNLTVGLADPSKDQPIPQISVDGYHPFECEGPECMPLDISVSAKKFTLIHQVDYEHFAIVREKLKW
jgi:NAD+ kinase